MKTYSQWFSLFLIATKYFSVGSITYKDFIAISSISNIISWIFYLTFKFPSVSQFDDKTSSFQLFVKQLFSLSLPKNKVSELALSSIQF